MDESLSYSFLLEGEEQKTCDLVLRVFDEFVAPYYSEEGINEFKSYITPELLAKRSKANHIVLIAKQSSKIVGMIEMRDNHHISLFFVSTELQTRGIGKKLFLNALAHCRKNIPSLTQLDVHSSPNAVSIYESLGFQQNGEKQIKNGICFIPMLLKLADSQCG